MGEGDGWIDADVGMSESWEQGSIKWLRDVVLLRLLREVPLVIVFITITLFSR